jgi:hypothetical protein
MFFYSNMNHMKKYNILWKLMIIHYIVKLCRYRENYMLAKCMQHANNTHSNYHFPMPSLCYLRIRDLNL